MKNRLDLELEEINEELTRMGLLVRESIDMAVEALMKKDKEAAKKSIEFDKEVDDKEKEIEALCFKVLLQQHPVAKDLRQISAALKMITDMERIGDQAADISEIVISLSDEEYVKELVDIPKMAKATTKMVKDSIEAYVNADLKLAESVIEYDDVVDDLFLIVRADVIEIIRENIAHSEQAADILMIAKYLERIGDHATNIAEWVIFSLEGRV